MEVFDDLVDPDSSERPARTHELAVDINGRIFLGEIHNH
jgi:hypothetical protein